MQSIWIISFTFSNPSYSFIPIYCHECIIFSNLVNNVNYFRFHKKFKQMRWISNYFDIFKCFWHDKFSLQYFIEIWPKLDYKVLSWNANFVVFSIQWSWEIMYVMKWPWLSTYEQSNRNVYWLIFISAQI